MACFGRYGTREHRSKMVLFERASPALKEVLLKLHRDKKPMEIDHHMCEVGSVQYHIKSSVSDPDHVYLSICTPSLSQGMLIPDRGDQHLIKKVKNICPGAVDIINPAKTGYQLTIQLNLAQVPQGKGGTKIITEIASVQSLLLTSQLKEMLCNFHLQDALQGTYRPIKTAYDPREPFFIIMKSEKISVVFPMWFREPSDAAIAMSFFQELMDVGSSEALAKAPSCTWSPVPPPELRGQPAEDLNTNGGFVSFDILPRHIRNKHIDKTVWNLLKFTTYVRSHVKCTRGFIQRLMSKRSEHLVKVMTVRDASGTLGNISQCKVIHETGFDDCDQIEKAPGHASTRESIRLSRLKKFRRRCTSISSMITRFHYRIKVQRFRNLNHRRFTIPKCSCAQYKKLE